MSTVPASRKVARELSRQEAWCAVFKPDFSGIDCAASFYGGPDCPPDDSAFTFPQFWTDSSNGITAGIDALGQLDDGSFGTKVQGSVSESPLPNGLADVKVIVHTSNALMRAFIFDPGPDLVSGYGLFEVEHRLGRRALTAALQRAGRRQARPPRRPA